MSVRWNRAQAQSAGLGAALTLDPGLRVFVGCGYYDLLGGCYAGDYAARHLPAELAARVTSRVYAGGHATYTDEGPRRQIQKDVVAFIRAGAAGSVSAGIAAPQLSATFREPEAATTHHQIRLNGSVLGYTARTGLLPIRHSDSGDVRGQFGFTSYTVDMPPGRPPRPIVFLWNGGPGADSTTVQFTGFGPRRIRTTDDPARPMPVEPGLYDNDATWLAFADLVFVDPIGTGFARPSKPEYAEEFYNTLGDIASTAEFIRAFRVRFDRLDAPLFLAGESYGTWRAAGAAEILEKSGVRIAGLMLISGGLAMGQASPDPIRTALFLPARTATAFYHGALGPELMRDERATLKEAQAWALNVYAPAWERRESLPDAERDRIVESLANYTGVRPSSIDRAALGMTSPQFTSTLLNDRGLSLGRYDMRVVQRSDAGRGAGASDSEAAPRNAVILRYLRDDLGFKSDLPYQGLETGWASASGQGRGVGARWAWNQGDTGRPSVGSGDGPPGGSQPWTRRALALDPGLKVFVAAGKYDSLNSCADNEWSVAHLEPAVAGNFRLGCYAGGHTMYDTKAARFSLRDDVAAFVTSASR
jgi:carboxypeptidase C (cathepsin A)